MGIWARPAPTAPAAAASGASWRAPVRRVVSRGTGSAGGCRGLVRHRNLSVDGLLLQLLLVACVVRAALLVLGVAVIPLDGGAQRPPPPRRHPLLLLVVDWICLEQNKRIRPDA
uniref:Uncharacterized protein n=1 Tax=Setaria italica TaxID=4555 RepID=K4A060_SETIT